MRKHSNKNKKLQSTIRIDDIDDIKKVNPHKNKSHTAIDNKGNRKGKKNKKEKLKKPPSKLKKFILRFILIVTFLFAIVFGIWQGIEACKWQLIAKQMCSNSNSIVVDIQR